ncbi:hypothetical protein LTR84_005609 [Exophiala bonariae]|uniref:Uncharacterized protein n=1 Tax=Exophiala bonariae TaxID=1690606 RepID=A0AAV9N415_9EURO|nr:hypothetical protein LTR84_005609 [Exophiala bonariae]
MASNTSENPENEQTQLQQPQRPVPNLIRATRPRRGGRRASVTVTANGSPIRRREARPPNNHRGHLRAWNPPGSEASRFNGQPSDYDVPLIRPPVERLPSPGSAAPWGYRRGYVWQPVRARDVIRTIDRLKTTLKTGEWTLDDTGVVRVLVIAYYHSGRDPEIGRAVQGLFDHLGWTRLNLQNPAIVNLVKRIDEGQFITQIALDHFAFSRHHFFMGITPTGVGLYPAWNLVWVHGYCLRVPAGAPRDWALTVTPRNAHNAFIHQLLTFRQPEFGELSLEQLRVAGLLDEGMDTVAAIIQN